MCAALAHFIAALVIISTPLSPPTIHPLPLTGITTPSFVMLVLAQPVRCRLRLVTLLAVALLHCYSTTFTAADVTPITSFSIPYTTYGPQFVNPAAVARVNATIYGGRLPYPDLTLPVLRIAECVTLTGPYNQYASIHLSTLSFVVDMINAHGGLVFNNTRYLLSVTTASDDSSDVFLLYLYSQWLNDPSYFLFITPPVQQQQVTVWPLVKGTNRTWTSFLPLGAEVLPDYPYRFSVLPSWSKLSLPTFNAINARAQLYHEEVIRGTVRAEASTVTSQWGVLTVCLYMHNDSSTVDQARGVRAWVNSTNAARAAAGASASDMITIVQDIFWPVDATSVDETLYQKTFELCPDNVDLLVVCQEISTADMTAVANALAASLLRPKAAYTTSFAFSYDPTDLQMLKTWQWWITTNGEPISQATLPLSTFQTLAEMGGAFAQYHGGTLPNIGDVLHAVMFDTVRSALSQAASLSSDDLRAAFLSLNGANFGQHVHFNNVTGNNDAGVVLAYQLRSTGSVLVQNLSQMAYPAPFPWRRTMVGDSVHVQQAGSTVVVAAVISVLGCWVAQIVLEQAIYMKRRGGWYRSWLLNVAVTLGGSGVLFAQFALSSAVTLSCPSTGDLPMRWSLPVALVAWVPAVLLTWCALVVGMRDFEDQSTDEKHRGSAAYEAKVARQHAEETKRKRAALDSVEHVRHIRRSMSCSMLAAGVLLWCAIVLSRVAMMYVWSVQASAPSSVGGWLVSVFISLPLVTLSVLGYFHGLRRRFVSAFGLAAVILLDWQSNLLTRQFTYTSAARSTPAPLYTVLMSSTAVTLLCGIVAAVTCFGFVGLQFNRMQLSRHGLSVLVATMEATISARGGTIRVQASQLRKAAMQTDAMAKAFECIALLRPLHANLSLALSLQANASTLRELFDPVLDSGATASTPPKARLSEMEKAGSLTRQLNASRRTATNSAAVSPLNTADIAVLSCSALSSQASTDSGGETLGHPLSPLSSLNGWLVDAATAAPGTAAAHSGSATLPSAPPTRHGFLRPARSSAVEAADASGRSTAPLRPCTAALASVNPSRDARESVALLTDHDVWGSEADSHDRHMASWKQYETDVMFELQHQQSEHSSVSHPHADSTEQRHQSSVLGSRSSIDTADFSFLLPAIATSTTARRECASITTAGRPPSVGGTTSNNSGAGCPFPQPSLQQLLQHPVCIELVRDELTRLHSEENLTFYLHALRYRHIQSAALRRTLAHRLYDTYIADNSSQQINVGQLKCAAVTAAIRRKGADACGSGLLVDCAREVLSLMETNIKSWLGGASHHLCVWLYYAVDVKRVVGWQEDTNDVGEGCGGNQGRDKRDISDSMSVATTSVDSTLPPLKAAQ